MTVDINEIVRQDLYNNLSLIASGGLEYWESHLVYPDLVIRTMESLGFVKGQFETEGWEMNWNRKMEHPKSGIFMVTGNGYYGGVQIGKDY